MQDLRLEMIDGDVIDKSSDISCLAPVFPSIHSGQNPPRRILLHFLTPHLNAKTNETEMSADAVHRRQRKGGSRSPNVVDAC